MINTQPKQVSSLEAKERWLAELNLHLQDLDEDLTYLADHYCEFGRSATAAKLDRKTFLYNELNEYKCELSLAIARARFPLTATNEYARPTTGES